MNDLTLLYYTADLITEHFANQVKYHLWKHSSKKSIPIISISQKPSDFGSNICVGDIGVSGWNIYYQILIGAKSAKTKYVACAEDDTLYTPEHFAFRPADDEFAYNTNRWNVQKNLFFYRKRAGMCTCIAPTELMITTLEARLKKYPKETFGKDKKMKYWGEPGRYETKLGLPNVKMITFETENPPLTFNHRPSYGGVRALLKTDIKKEELPYWGKAEDLWMRIHG